MKAHVQEVDYSRYFTLKQRAYLINVSEERDREHYESISGIIIDRSGSTVALQIPYPTEQDQQEISEANPVSFKLTSESLGGGIQMMADLIKVTSGNVYHLQLRGNLEMYQRRRMPRVDTQINLFQIRRNASLAVYRKEFKRISDYLKTQGVPANLRFVKTPVNLSAGGLNLVLEPDDQLTPLGLFFIDIFDKQSAMCVVAEMVWNRLEDAGRRCGYRFVQISKKDQDRLKSHVQTVLKQQGIEVQETRNNWELLDRMTFDR